MLRMYCRLLAPLLVAQAGANLAAQAPNPGNYSKAQYQVREWRNQLVPVRDGVRLSVDIYRPDSPDRVPTILSITPYDNAGTRVTARWWAERGYAVVWADSRGRFDSEGEWDPFDAKHKTDGYDLVEWAARQPWSTGRVGMIGGSYGGWTQWWTASTAPPSLKAIAPFVAPPDGFENAPYQHGVLAGWIIDWAAAMSGRTHQTVQDGPYWGWTKTRYQDLRRTPYVDLNKSRGLVTAPWFETWIRDNLATSAYWKGIAYQGRGSCERMTVPALNVTGWFDANHPGSPANYTCMRQYGATSEARRPTLVIGPWHHGANARTEDGFDYGPSAIFDLNGYVARWFDHFLKGVDNGVTADPPVFVFVMGPNEWRGVADWPLPGTQWTKYYFQSGGRANSLKGDGVLTTTPPGVEGSASYTYDPANPTISAFGDHGHIPGAVDTRLSALGDDVLVYQTPVLTEDLQVIGPIEAKVFAATSARDTDWMVRLIDVHPNGYAALLTDGVIRARNRDPNNEGRFTATSLTTIAPDQVHEYTIKFWRGTGNVFKAGHRVRVEVSSSYYPYYLRNLNTGSDNVGLATEDQAVVATQRVYHGGRYPSHLVLPVIPRG